MITDDGDSWATTSAFVATTNHDSVGSIVASAVGGHVTSTAAAFGNDVRAGPIYRHNDQKFFNSTASPLVAAAIDDVTWMPVSTSGGDADDEPHPGLLWLPYVIFTIVLFSLIALSFVRFHCQRGHQYRRRQAELSDKRPYRQLQQPTPDHLRLLGSETGSAGGGQPNGGLSSSGGYIPEQMNLFVQYSQVLPDDCYVTGMDENASRSIKKNGSGGKRGGLNRRPLVFTFNSNGSMVDVRCDEEERTNTFRLVPNADSAGGDELEVQEIDLGNGELDDLDPSPLPQQVPLTPQSLSISSRQLPVQYRGNIGSNEPLANSLNLIPPPPSTGATVNRTTASSGGGSSHVVNGRDRSSPSVRYHSSNHSAITTTAQSIPSSASRHPDQNHLSPSMLTDLSKAVPDGARQRSMPVYAPSNSPPPRPSTSSSSPMQKPPSAMTSHAHQRSHVQQHIRSSPTHHQHHHPHPSHLHHHQQHHPHPSHLHHHQHHHPHPSHLHHHQQHHPHPSHLHHHQHHHPHPSHLHHHQQHRLSSASTASNSRLNHHVQHPRTHHSHRPGTHYSPLNASDRNRKDLFGSDDDETGLNCAAEALLLWQRRV